MHFLGWGFASMPCSSANSDGQAYPVVVAVTLVTAYCRGYIGQDYSAGMARVVAGTFLSSFGRRGGVLHAVGGILRRVSSDPLRIGAGARPEF